MLSEAFVLRNNIFNYRMFVLDINNYYKGFFIYLNKINFNQKS